MWLERQFGARLDWLPFDLHPEYPPQGIPRAELVTRYGEGYDARTREMFAAEGLTYSPPPDVVSNTRLALELGEAARAEGLHRAYHDRLMDAYWAEGVDLSQRPRSSRSRRASASRTRQSRKRSTIACGRSAVDHSTARAQAAGATGVPRVRDRLAAPGRRCPAARAARAARSSRPA